MLPVRKWLLPSMKLQWVLRDMQNIRKRVNERSNMSSDQISEISEKGRRHV